jgi:Arc/MetJ-type ribon-helix-helix transcriptional regulator
MKVSVSLPEGDVEFLDEYGRAVGAPSRSAVLHRAVRLLRATALGPAYSQAWEEWEAEGQAEGWESVADDGLAPDLLFDLDNALRLHLDL